eukprot:1158391-Pelagomonas_calceolata.AAC.3
MQDGRRAPCLLRFIGLRLLLALLLVLSVEVVLLLIHLPEGIVQEDAQHAPTGIWVCQNDDLTCPVDQSLQPPLSMAGLHSVPVTDVHLRFGEGPFPFSRWGLQLADGCRQALWASFYL